MHELVIATGNPHKVEEIRAVLESSQLRVISLTDAGGPFPEPEETGRTFVENAKIKAVAYARRTGKWCLADDSGLEVDALDGAPGVISSHYGTDGVETGLSREQRDASNNERLLRELNGIASEGRGARFVCQMILSDPGGSVRASARGTFEGRIGEPPRVPAGANGFGYDPLFLVAPEHARTSAEMDPAEKNAQSHRGNALREMIGKVESAFASLA